LGAAARRKGFGFSRPAAFGGPLCGLPNAMLALKREASEAHIPLSDSQISTAGIIRPQTLHVRLCGVLCRFPITCPTINLRAQIAYKTLTGSAVVSIKLLSPISKLPSPEAVLPSPEAVLPSPVSLSSQH